MPIRTEAVTSKERTKRWLLVVAVLLAVLLLPPVSVVALTWNRPRLLIRMGRGWIDFRHTRYPYPRAIDGGDDDTWRVGPIFSNGDLHGGMCYIKLPGRQKRGWYAIAWLFPTD